MLVDRYNNTPLDIKLIGLLSLLITIASSVLRLESMNDIQMQIMPLVGWSPAIIYDAILLLLIFNILFSNNYKVSYVRKFILVFLALGLVIGLYDTMTVTQELMESSNPYLRRSPYRWLYMIALPAILFLYVGFNRLKDSKRTNRIASDNSKSSSRL